MLCFVDVDHFKSVNDRFGHAAGDDALRSIASVLRKTARSIDFVGRWGGEEFLVVAPGTQLSEGVILGERLRIAMETSQFTVAGERTVQLTISVGLAEYPENARSVEGLIATADAALYVSKQGPGAERPRR